MSLTSTQDLVELAAAHGSTKWVKQFIRDALPPLIEQALLPEAFAASFEQALQERNLLIPAQQKNYRSNLCQALKVIDENHPAYPLCQAAIALVSLTTEQYRELNDEQRGRLSDRETKFFTSQVAEQLVERATALLDSAEWSEVGAGLAVLIGRRISEILLSEFSLKSQWSLNFSEMAKKSDATELEIEIPTLAPAPKVFAAIQKLQSSLNIQDLKVESLTPKIAKQKVNSRFSHAIAGRCDQHFHDLIPTRSDRENLYSHIFRAVYATIAAHWFCPPTVPEHQFKAEIQGHFTIAQDGKKLPNFSARANYDDYAIGTQDGNRDGRLGVKLGQLPDLQVIEAFRKTPEPKPAETSIVPASIELTLETMRAFAARAVNLFIAHEPPDLAIAVLALTGQFPQMFTEYRWEEASKFSLWLETEQWEIPTLTAASQILSGIEKLSTISLPPQEVWIHRARDVFAGLLEIEDLTDLQAIYTQIAIYRFCPPTIQEAAFIEIIRGTVSQQISRASSERGIWLDQRNVMRLRMFQSPEFTQPMTSSDSNSSDPTSIAVNLDLLSEVCDIIGIDLNEDQGPEAAIEGLLLWVRDSIGSEVSAEPDESDRRPEPEQPEEKRLIEPETGANSVSVSLEQSVLYQAKTLALLSTQVELLQQQVQQLQSERDAANDLCRDAIAQVTQLRSASSSDLQQELDQLRQQNEHLKTKVQRLTTALLSETEVEQPIQQPVAVPLQTTQHYSSDVAVQAESPRQRQERAPSNSERGSRGNAIPKINRVIDAIIKHNQEQPDSSQRLRISIPIIKDIGEVLNAKYQPAIQQVLEARKSELEALHQQWMLGERHNRQVKNQEEIIHRIQQNLLNQSAAENH